jgi:glycosyltransferase involved in cell wall biosynthesis
MKKITLVIATRNRIDELKITLNKISSIIAREDVELIVADDGSVDGTSNFINEYYPSIKLLTIPKSNGIHYVRNLMFQNATSDFIISLDDDIHFLTVNVIEQVLDYFKIHQECAVLAFRIYWSKFEPSTTISIDKSIRVKSFGAGAHAFRVKAWHEIPNYPEWFVFYGEEDFASYQLFKKGWEIHYFPQVLMNHRVDLKSRKNNADYTIRLRRSLRSGWYLYLLFIPFQHIPRKMVYSIWMQLKSKVFKGDRKALQAIVLALFDLLLAIPRIIKNSNRLTNAEYKEYQKLAATKLYWKPEDK